MQEWEITEADKIIGEVLYKIPQPQSAMVIMDYHNGHVLAIAGGRGEKLVTYYLIGYTIKKTTRFCI